MSNDIGVYKKVPIASIKIGERFRKEYHDIESLAESIKHRMLYPIILNKNYELVEGGRRLEAAQWLNWEEIPALIRDESEEIDLRELELLGNMEREDFTWVENVALIQKIHELHLQKDSTWSGRKTATRLNRSKSLIAKQLKLADRIKEVPELTSCKTEAEAEKFLNNVEETLAMQELAARRETQHGEVSELIARVGKALEEHNAEKAAKVNNPGTTEIIYDKDPVVPDFDLNSEGGYIVADFFEVAKTLPDAFLGDCALIECDPDFGIDPGLFLKKTKDPSSYHTAGVPIDQYPAFLVRLASECYRLLGESSTLIFWFGIEFYKEAREALKAAGFNVNLNPAIWFKPGENYGTAHNANQYLCNVVEYFFVATKGLATLGKPRSRNVFEFERPHSSDRFHPTEKPVALLEEIIETCYVAHPASKCMAAFAGSGNILRACKNLGIEAFGFDLSEEYRNKYLLRLEENDRK